MFRATIPIAKFTRSVTAAAAAASIGGLALTAGPARAATAGASPDVRIVGGSGYTCVLQAWEPRLSVDGVHITGTGGSLCSGSGWQPQRIVVTLEELVLPTLYLVRAQASSSESTGNHLEQTVSWACTGGTHTFTIETSWYGDNGNVYGYAMSPEPVKISCPG